MVKLDSSNLTFSERMDLVKLLLIELRQPPFGLIGMIESRNLIARLFPDFAEVRDQDVDDIIKQYANDTSQQYTDPNQLQLG